MRQLWTVTANDLRQRVRDRSVVIFGLIVPFAFMAAFNLVMGGLDEGPDLDPVTVAVSVPMDDEIAAALVGVLRQVDILEVTVEEMSAEEVPTAADDGAADLGLIVPAGFAEAVRTGEEVVVEVVQGTDSLETGVLRTVIDGALDQFAAGTVAAAAGARAGLAPERLAQVGQQAAAGATPVTLVEGRASDEQLDLKATIVAGQSGLFLMFTVGFGVLALLYERQEGTMPRLLSMPMRPGTVVAAKALGAFLLGVGATTVLLTAGSLLFGVGFGSLPAVAALVVCVVAAATSLMFIVARLAKTPEQAGNAQAVLALVLGMAGGAFFPITGSGLAGVLLDLNPIAAFLRGLGITSGGGGLGDIGVPVATMLGFAIVCAGISRLLPDRGAEV